MNIEWHDAVGSLGVAVIIAVYFLLQLGRMNVQQLAFSLLNCIGASLILVSLVFEFNLAAFTIEAFWVLISLFGVYRVMRQGSTSQPGQ